MAKYIIMSKELFLPEPEMISGFTVDGSVLSGLRLAIARTALRRPNFKLYGIDSTEFCRVIGEQDFEIVMEQMEPLLDAALRLPGRVTEMHVVGTGVKRGQVQTVPFWHHDHPCGTGDMVVISDTLTTEFAVGSLEGGHPVSKAKEVMKSYSSKENILGYSSAIDLAIDDSDLKQFPTLPNVGYHFNEQHAHRAQINNTDETVDRTVISIVYDTRG